MLLRWHLHFYPLQEQMIWRPQTTRSKVLVALGSIVATLIVVLLVANFSTGEKQITQEIPRLYSVDDPQFLRAMGVLLGPPIVAGNRVEALLNGDEIFPSMLAAIRGAQGDHHFRDLHLLVGRRSARSSPMRSPSARAPASRCTCCSTGSAAPRWTRALVDEMKAAGVEVQQVPPAALVQPRPHEQPHAPQAAGRRRHASASPAASASRDQWTGHAQDPDHWRDTHFRVEGPVVAQMQAVLHGQLDQGHRRGAARRRLLSRARSRSGDGDAQMFSSSPTGGSESMELMYLMAITAAAQTIRPRRAPTSCRTS